jgi:AcrR family transcriptional regulator
MATLKLKTPRPSRWERRPEARPDEILDAALEVFAAQGYRATRLDEVARAAGVTKGTIYHYFTGKEQLLLAAVRRRQQKKVAEIQEALGDAADPVSVRIARLYHSVWERWTDPKARQVLRLMLSSVSIEAPEVFRTWMREGFVTNLRMLTSLIEQGKAQGDFRPDVDAEVAARLLQSAMVFQMLLHFEWGLNELAPISNSRLVEQGLDVFMRGLSNEHHSNSKA